MQTKKKYGIAAFILILQACGGGSGTSNSIVGLVGGTWEINANTITEANCGSANGSTFKSDMLVQLNGTVVTATNLDSTAQPQTYSGTLTADGFDVSGNANGATHRIIVSGISANGGVIAGSSEWSFLLPVSASSSCAFKSKGTAVRK